MLQLCYITTNVVDQRMAIAVEDKQYTDFKFL